jgi:replication factor C large subunit
MLPWTQKYAPEKIEDVAGNSSATTFMKEWAKSPTKPLFLYGPPGVGKSTAALALANAMKWEFLEMNASDLRSKDAVNRIAGLASVSGTFSGKSRMILFDEIDSMVRDDRGGLSAVASILKQSRVPVIVTANDLWNPKLTAVRGLCEKVQFKRVHYATIAGILEKICKKEGIKAEKSTLVDIAKMNHGDIKSAINDLQAVASVGEVTEKDLELLSERDRTGTMYNAVMKILKTRDFQKSRKAFDELDEDPDFVFAWVEQNIPNEYDKADDLGMAFDRLSKADVYKGRIMRRQSWGLFKYYVDLMTAGVSLSKRETYKKFARYEFPAFIRHLSKSKKARGLRKAVGLKIGKKVHVSSSVAIQDYFPMVQTQFKKNPVELTRYYDFSEDEVAFLLGDEKKAKKIREEASKIPVVSIRKSNQNSLSEWQ